MRLIRKTDPQGRGKYALINLEKLRRDFKDMPDHAVRHLLNHLQTIGLLTYGTPGDPDEFFAIKLKDVHAKAALTAYAQSCRLSDPELSMDVMELAAGAGVSHPNCKHPD